MRKIPHRSQRGPFWSAGRLFLVTEGLFFLYAYSIYYKLNRYQEFRHRYSKKHPWILDKYYRIGEMVGGLDTRKHDREYWNKLESEQSEVKS